MTDQDAVRLLHAPGMQRPSDTSEKISESFARLDFCFHPAESHNLTKGDFI
jgi:hypothetical protein